MPPLDLAESPGDQQEVAGPSLNRARAREERLGERVADGAKTKLVTGLWLGEQLDDL